MLACDFLTIETIVLQRSTSSSSSRSRPSGSSTSRAARIRTHAITRHPIYAGLLGMLLGTALLNGLGVSLAILFVGAVFLATRIAIEERLMNKRFSDEYAHYRERVPRLVPGLRVHRRSQLTGVTVSGATPTFSVVPARSAA
jgi:Phospholipid methyltransferase